jgi:hypothetical protein
MSTERGNQMDIVEKLRELSALEKSFPMSGTCWYEKAADEIEQLREALRPFADLYLWPDDSECVDYVKTDEDWNDDSNEEKYNEVFICRAWIRKIRNLMRGKK